VDKEGKPYSVRYEHINAVLLNKFLKEHRAFVEQQHKIARHRQGDYKLRGKPACTQGGFTRTLRDANTVNSWTCCSVRCPQWIF
jgi:hypothetical protein